MGNALRALLGKCCNPAPDEDGHASRPHGVTTATVGVSALAADLFHFDNTGEVPDGLSKHVVSSRKAQANWYNKLRVAWKEAKPPPKTPEEASRLIVETLKRHKKEDVQGLLAFYGLPAIDGLPDQVPARRPIPSAERIKFEFITFTVDPKCVADGDTITVYVDTKDPRESRAVPPAIKDAFARRSKARAKRDYEEADILQKQILAAHYRVISGPSGEVLARKYRIRLRGIDAPESSMPYGAEAKAALLKLVEGKSLKVLVYGEDQYGRSVADVYCGDIFVQEFMLKKGLAWHYVAYDKCPEFAQWEKNARAARLGLWAASNPEKPWEWRNDNPRGA